ncbi:tumor necrosis factor receptor superfamily member 11B-like [Chanos chanos]|uniref:Tumor necrosis factor receptor superfamily member 11B-like n=1 Tax=Chanos chanos TaxID=29144 RepID=A0A6J2W4L3_CHACN|nr:tumor necrosis factor receptor superfamily member 11B-like [Chanos chanos]
MASSRASLPNLALLLWRDNPPKAYGDVAYRLNSQPCSASETTNTKYEAPLLVVPKNPTLFTLSLAWALHETQPPKYQYRDPKTSELLLCDQCPPGTAVHRHCGADGPTVCTPCPEKHFSEQWHWDDSCQYCTTVCKERQLVRRECNSTHDRLCECMPGYHLLVEFCVKHTACPPGSGVVTPGTPISDTVCEKCPLGHYSSMSSTTEACVPHRNCTQLGLKTLHAGSATEDTVCESDAKDSSHECTHRHTGCHTDITLCEEAVFRFLASPRLASVPLERLLESLPGRRVDWKSVERLKKACSPQQQVLQLLRMWREQNKDQDKLYRIIQGVNHCERKVSRCTDVRNLTLGDLLLVMESLPGEKVSDEDVHALIRSCPSKQYILQLLHLWKSRNDDQDLVKGLAHGLRKLRSQGAPRHLLKTLKRISRIITASSLQRMYEKIILSMIQDSSCFKSKPYND